MLSPHQNIATPKSLVDPRRRRFLGTSVATIAASVFGSIHTVLGANVSSDIKASQQFLLNRGFDLEKANAKYDAAMKKRIVDAGPVETTLSHEFLSPARISLINSLSGGFGLNPEMMRRLVIIESEGKIGAISSK